MSIQTYGCGSLTATGTTQGTAAPITTDHVLVNTSAGNTGAILPAGCYRIIVKNVVNLGLQSLNLYPPVGGTIDGGAINAAKIIAQGINLEVFSLDGGTTWTSISIP